MSDPDPPPSDARQPARHSLPFRVGLSLMIASLPLGAGVVAVATAIGRRTGHLAGGVAWGVGLYIFSWGLLGLGFLLAGPEGLARMRDHRRRWFGGRPG
jgi:hypothetical protein